MCLAQGPQRSDAGEAQTRGPSVSSQALYHWATMLPHPLSWEITYEPVHVMSNSVTFWHVYTWMRLCRLLLSFEIKNGVQSVA